MSDDVCTDSPDDDMVIEETTVGGIGNWSIGVSNIWERDFTDQNGNETYGMTASVSLFNAGDKSEVEQIVGRGSLLDLGKDGRWEVVELTAGNGLGTIKIRKIE